MISLDNARTWLAEHDSELVSWRHRLHANPELAFGEHLTGDFIAQELLACGLDVSRGIGRTGLVATLQGRASGPGKAGPAIGLRADMDALPMEEANRFDHRSTTSGRMHACGHDGHVVMLMAAARFLADQKSRGHLLPGTVRFIFQPAEENAGGAQVMIEDGLFERFPVDYIYGLHNFPGVPVGNFLIRSGPVTAGFDTFDITVNASGGHAAFAAAGGDAVGAAAALVGQLQTIVSRHVAAMENAVLAVTQINGGTAYNVLPDKVTISGSVRWFRPEVRDEIRQRIQLHTQGIAQPYAVSTSLDYHARYPSAINHPEAANIASQAACDAVGSERLIGHFPPSMGSDDFAFMLEKRPGAYLAMGNGVGMDYSALHSPRYDFNDRAITPGALGWIALCLRFFRVRLA